MLAGGGTTHYVSVSELYSCDEVSLLLEEIRELEPSSCRGEELQDFEIAGSGVGGGGRSPAHTEHSWDSHAQYSRAPPPAPRALAPVYCQLRRIIELRGILTLTLIVCSAATCGCIWAVVGTRPWLLPLADRIRLLLLGGITSLMLHSVLLMMHVTNLTALMPINWDKMGAWIGAWSCVTLCIGGLLTLHAVLLSPLYLYTPTYISVLLYTAAGCGLLGAIVGFGLWWLQCGPVGALRVCLAGRSSPEMVPCPAPAEYAALPSTSRDDQPL